MKTFVRKYYAAEYADHELDYLGETSGVTKELTALLRDAWITKRAAVGPQLGSMVKEELD